MTRGVFGHLIKRGLSAFGKMSRTRLLDSQYVLRNTTIVRAYHTDIRDQRMRASSREGREQESSGCSDER
jgi:hypothetical protein